MLNEVAQLSLAPFAFGDVAFEPRAVALLVRHAAPGLVHLTDGRRVHPARDGQACVLLEIPEHSKKIGKYHVVEDDDDDDDDDDNCDGGDDDDSGGDEDDDDDAVEDDRNICQKLHYY